MTLSSPTIIQFLGRWKERLYLFGITVVVFLSSIFPFRDKDWGWHYKYGEYFFLHGKLLTQEIYSWTLPTFSWVNHSWAYDLFLYQASKAIHFQGLSLLAGLSNAVSFFLLTRCTKGKLSTVKLGILAIFFILLTETGLAEGLRSQVISLLFFSILTVILIFARHRLQILYTLPALFLVWTNIHGDFTLGLGIAGIFLGSYGLIETLKSKVLFSTKNKRMALVLFISFLITFINPFTYKVYVESFNHAANPYLRNVFEWQGVFKGCPECHPTTFVIFSVAIIFYLIKRHRLEDLPFWILFPILWFPTYGTRRLLPVFCVIMLPFLARAFVEHDWKIEKMKITSIVIGLCILIGLEYNLFTRLPNFHFYSYSESDYCTFGSGCSPKMAQYLVDNPPIGKGFNFYDWGGYFIGKGFPQKLFVDGRMHVWKEDEYQPFGDYIEMYYNKQFELFMKYDFDWAILSDKSDLANKIKQTDDLGKWKWGFKDGESDYFIRIRE